MEADKLVQALAVAWGGAQLYPEPAAVPSFVKAVEAISEFAGNPVVLTVGVDGFATGTTALPTAHGAADRLVHALFSHRVESLQIAAPVTPEEMIGFFAAVGEEVGEGDLDLPTRLALAGLTAIRIRCHDPLEDRDEDEPEAESDIERHPDVEVLFESDSVERIAERIMLCESPEAAGVEFVDLIRSAYGLVTPGDPAGLERVVQTFTDAFFRLDHGYRVPAFEAIVEARDEPVFENFLDQLSADELAELAAQVDNAALPLLVEYARVVTEMQGRDPGLVSMVMGEQRATDARGAVAGTIGVHLAEFLTADSTQDTSVKTITAEVAALAVEPRMGSTVLSDLFAIEQRNDRLQRLLRIWVAKMSGAIKSGALPAALEWLEVVKATYLDARLIDEAYGHLASDEILEILTTGDSDHDDLRKQLLQELSHRAGDRVLQQLATEEDPARRHILIEIVTEIARVDVRSVLPGLSDPRWFVVRNIAIALGKSGRKAAADPLTQLLDHDDHRVRIEALRALLLCIGPSSVDHLVRGLGDEHERVRAAAGYLLATLDDESVLPALTSAVTNETLPVEGRVAAIVALGRLRTESANGVLTRVADSKVRFSASARALRSAARDALRSRDA